MKKLKNITIKVALYMLFILIISATFSNSYAYEIKSIAVPKEELINDRQDFPDMLYRKQTAAYSTTITRYNNLINSGSDTRGWIYLGSNTVQSLTSISPIGHSQAYNFERNYEFFHPNQNSAYITDGTNSKRYYTKGELTTTDDITDSTVESRGYFTNIAYEYGGYKGLYNRNWASDLGSSLTTLRSDFYNDIILYKNNAYRYAIVPGTDIYLSDNILTKEMISDIKTKYAENINNGILTVYNSSVLETGPANGKYQLYMDTAYKFYETTIRGGNSAAWNGSTTINATDHRDSFVNYYDNTIDLPIERKS